LTGDLIVSSVPARAVERLLIVRMVLVESNPLYERGRASLAPSIRKLFKFVVGLFAALPGAATSSRAAEPGAVASTPGETLTMSAFIARIRQDAALRARFAQSPRVVLREFGIDPPPINLPDRLTDDQIQRLLNDWTAGVDPPARPPPARPALDRLPTTSLTPTPAYGPPSTPVPPPTPPPPAPPRKP
jgi:hypothetical protein